MRLATAITDLAGGSRADVETALENALVTLAQRVALLLLNTLGFVQDLLLSADAFRALLLFAFRGKHRSIVQQALVAQPANPSAFEQLEYFVDPQARQLLLFAALHALSSHLQADEVLAPAQLLPQVSRVLLQTEEAQPDKYLEAVAAALAAQMGAALLLVDGMLLASLASATFGKPPEAFLSAFSGGAGAAGPSRAANKLPIAWLALRDALFALDTPTVVYVRHTEQLLGSSFEAFSAFDQAWGGHEAAALALEGASSRAPLVLLGGVSVVESAAARAGVRPQLEPGWAGGAGDDEEDEGERGARPGRGGRGGGRGGGLFGGGGGGGGLPDGLEDDLGLGDLLLSLSRLASDGPQRPSARRRLARIFPTRVKLQPPPAGPAALRHQQRMEQDAAAEAEEENYRVAAAVAASTGVGLPPKASGIYAAASGKPLARSEWAKVLSWAVAIQTLQAKQGSLQQEQRQEEAEAAAAQQAIEAAQAAAAGGTGGEDSASSAAAGLRRRRGGGGSGAAAAEPAPPPRQAALASGLPSLAASLWRTANPLSLAAAAARLPWRALRGTAAAARWGWDAAAEAAGLGMDAAAEAVAWVLVRLPLVGGLFEEALDVALTAEELEAELQELQARLEAEQREYAALGGEGGAPAAALAAAGAGAGAGKLRLSEMAVQYGLGMLAKSSGSVKQAIQAGNNYERHLLSEVLSPEDCGRGFSEVGALQEAKAALREAVQLPLKHPELFGGGMLARPSKGVLLFGPPGTGKTLLARAAAAECGAAFLALNPSAVASKWFGDSVKMIRAAFTLAAKLSPCVIFIDEVDAMLGKRESRAHEHEAMREMKNELMQQWDGIRPGRARVMLLGATNRPFDLDEAVLRRFTHRIFIGLPDRAARLAILQVVLEGERLGPSVDLAVVAERTEGYSGSDLKQLCIQAAMRPVRAFLEQDSAVAAAAPEHKGALAQPKAVQQGEGPASAAAEAPAAEQEAAAAAAAEVAAPADEAAAAAAGEVPPADAPPAAEPAEAVVRPPLAVVPRLDSLLRQAERIASVPRNPRRDLRPITMQDFEEAAREVGASVDPDSSVVQELNEWNSHYGTTGSKRGVAGKRLSYYS